jgi:hypothetical protein
VWCGGKKDQEKYLRGREELATYLRKIPLAFGLHITLACCASLLLQIGFSGLDGTNRAN